MHHKSKRQKKKININNNDYNNYDNQQYQQQQGIMSDAFKMCISKYWHIVETVQTVAFGNPDLNTRRFTISTIRALWGIWQRNQEVHATLRSTEHCYY